MNALNSGYDSTSNITRHTKKTCLDVFVQHNHLSRALLADTVVSDVTIRNTDFFLQCVWCTNC